MDSPPPRPTWRRTLAVAVPALLFLLAGLAMARWSRWPFLSSWRASEAMRMGMECSEGKGSNVIPSVQSFSSQTITAMTASTARICARQLGGLLLP